MQVPEAVFPILEAISENRRFAGKLPVEIWRGEDQELLIEAFLELGCELFASDIPEEGLPDGYILTAFLFDWESHCQFEGWYALDNRSSTMYRVIECYKRVGLADEANAIDRANQAWILSQGDSEQAAAAYNSPRPRLGESKRFEHLVNYLVDNADRLFYLSDGV